MPVFQASSRTFTPNNEEGAMHMDDDPTPARRSLDPAMNKIEVVIDKDIYDGNAYIIGILLNKLYAQKAKDPIDIRALHELRNAVYNQQPNRLIPEVDQWLSELYTIKL
ncbi:hypothetical protein SARC_00043 [Sphaeroforma arctica JP610]|uniref:Uncharacterized protein n=1 Tax=Sphaeroforma arctica JP610 TaxID=667725 RepID=A0A0L0GFD9_9EUKA|nr:hypothetical protein SARC_00043 [Sphaeroforma arctica JP610]KNC87785.1 hypothetical protein SARC_00043 [Sphaeroforma arctica JP610]|eukprot:XP_014161687.1 hypothetical protein SARC_00043 [Sphaeroforma arctica JP610]